MDSRRQKHIQDRLREVFAPYWAKEQPMAEQPIATQDWHTRALVRIREQRVCRSPEGGEHTFHAGEELEMVQWGRAGRPIDRSAWWTSYDIDGAFIIESDKTEIVKILDEVAPIESKAAAYNREMDERNRIIRENVSKPWLPLHDGE